MNREHSIRHYWDGNADAWTQLSRAGYDVYRDYLNTPSFLRMLPPISGLSGLDIGCGEGSNTSQLIKLDAHMTAFDISHVFINHAHKNLTNDSIQYLVANAELMPFSSCIFDFAVGFMSFMDVNDLERLISEAYRVLKNNGFLQFSITHPCFDTPHRKNLRNKQGITYAIEVGNYFHNPNGEISEWIFGSTPPEVKKNFKYFKVPRYNYTLSHWLNTLINTGFRIECVEEPRPSDETIAKCPDIQDAQVVAYFLHIRARKV